jgi:hypothetical protein
MTRPEVAPPPGGAHYRPGLSNAGNARHRYRPAMTSSRSCATAGGAQHFATVVDARFPE